MAQLPPLALFRTFEAAARHLSFTKAAEELFVTQGAVSQQVKALEDQLGVKLFRRMTRAIRLTDEGQALLPYARGALEQLTEGVRQLEQQSAAGVLTISVLPSLASTWLMPRLCHFQARHPDIEVHLSATERLVDFGRDPVDAAIRYGQGIWTGLQADFLLAADKLPVCRPVFPNGTPAPREPQALARCTLLHTIPMPDDWRNWLHRAGITDIDAQRGLRFESTALTIQAAVNGLGVAIAPRALVLEDLEAGRLVEPFGFSLPNDWAYYFVAPEAHAGQTKIQLFRRWLLDEAGPPAQASSAKRDA